MFSTVTSSGLSRPTVVISVENGLSTTGFCPGKRRTYSTELPFVRLTVRRPLLGSVWSTFVRTDAVKRSFSSCSSPAIVPNE